MALADSALRVARRSRRIPRSQWIAFWRRRRVRPEVVLLEATGGIGLVCHPYAVFRALLAAEDLGHLRYVWVVRDGEDRRRARRHLRDLGLGRRRARVVGYRTLGYSRHLATAGYLVNNATFPGEFGKRAGQTYLNTWHGTPVKSMGYDTPGGVLDTRNIVRNLLAADHLVSSGPFMTRMYLSAYRMERIYRGAVLEVGAPRTDRQVLLTESEREDVRRRLRDRGVTLEDRRVVLVAPTWRGRSFGDPRLDVDEVESLVANLEARLGAQWQVLVKVHPVVHRRALEVVGLGGRLVPADVPTNDVLAVTDHLVTDYSSILFDALATPALPISFHVPDRDDYQRSRPLYVDVADLPGAVCATVDEVSADVLAGGSHAERRRAWAEAYAPLDDGSAADRVVDAVWRGRQTPRVGRRLADVDVATGPDGEPVPRLLIHAGPLQRNGITTSLAALLARLDHRRVDVTVLWGSARGADPRAFIDAVPDEVRLLPRVGGLTAPKRVAWSRRLMERWGADHPLVPMAALTAMMRQEWVRCLGDAQFDHVIDFSGYSPFWALFMSRGVAPEPVLTHSIWMHNDLAAEAEKSVGGRRTHARSLAAVFSLYPRFDRLVSVSPALARVNEHNLSRYAGDAAFRSARNLVDADRVRDRASAPLRHLGLPETVVAALEDEGCTTFVTAGRFSTEKNHARLVRAAAQVAAAGRRFAVVVMGAGPLEQDLRALVTGLGLDDVVLLPGHVANPLPVIAAADCLVLSSDHEGLPMVLLEAFALGTPVLTTAFSSVAGIIPEGAGRVVGRDDTELARAMMDVVTTPPRRSRVDVGSYDALALTEFAAAIDLGGGVTERADERTA